MVHKLHYAAYHTLSHEHTHTHQIIYINVVNDEISNLIPSRAYLLNVFCLTVCVPPVILPIIQTLFHVNTLLQYIYNHNNNNQNTEQNDRIYKTNRQ